MRTCNRKVQYRGWWMVFREEFEEEVTFEIITPKKD